MTARAFNPPGQFDLPKSDARHYGARGGHAKAASLSAVYMIEGESVTAEEISARIGRAITTTRAKIRAAQRQPGPVTWHAIREAGK